MRFQVLGPLGIVTSEGTVELHAGKLSSLLAALLLRAGQTASSTYLTEAVWDVDVPEGGRAAMHTSILRLRRLFASHGASPDLVVTTAQGYRVPVDGVSLDLIHFRETVAASEEQSEPVQRLRMLRSALRLWTSAPTGVGPLANVPSELLRRDVVPLLVEEWKQAAERCFALELGLGNPRGIIGELREATSAFPTHEGFSAQLAEALWLAERQHEALAEIRRLRELLRDELGLTPGESVRRLELGILRGERPTSRGPVPQGPVITADLVPDCTEVRRLRDRSRAGTELHGRDREIDILETALTTGGGVAVILGAPGVGKSALAAALVARLESRFPRGVSYRCGCHPSPLGEGDAGRLIVVENAHGADIAELRACASGGTRILLVSRFGQRELAGEAGVLTVRLAPLDEFAAVRLARQLLGGRATSDRGALARLSRMCGGFPGAIALACARLQLSRDGDLGSFLTWLGHDPVRRLSTSRNPRTSLAATYEDHLACLHPASSAAFYALADQGGGDFDVEDAATLLETSELEAEIALEELVDACLLEVDTAGRYFLLDLPRQVAACQALRVGPGRSDSYANLLSAQDRRRA
jgi:DNA-binding SARP family transcriptional activator